MDVRRSFRELAKRWHPARFARHDPAIVRLANEVFLAMREAQDLVLVELSATTAIRATTAVRGDPTPIPSKPAAAPAPAPAAAPVPAPARARRPTPGYRPAQAPTPAAAPKAAPAATAKPTPSSGRPPIIPPAPTGPSATARPPIIPPAPTGPSATARPPIIPPAPATGPPTRNRPATIPTPSAPAPTPATRPVAPRSAAPGPAVPRAPTPQGPMPRLSTSSTSTSSSGVGSGAGSYGEPERPRRNRPISTVPGKEPRLSAEEVKASTDAANQARDRFERALDAIRRQKWGEARTELESLAATAPADQRYRAYLHYVQGWSAFQLGKDSEARAEWQKALACDPGLGMARWALESTGLGR